jgi:aspartyl-tRNA(Asn)/glutamyl-tRNA(Gln) amidotransferase subunit A
VSIEKLTINQIRDAYQNNQLSPTDVVGAYAKSYQDGVDINAYVEHFGDEAMASAKALDATKAKSALLWGIPGAIKDNFSIKGKGLSCASNLLKGYVSPYDSSVVEQLNAQHFINIGRLNMDEFAMGSTGTYSSYGATLNPLDITRLPGGSSSGSAAAVAAHQCAFSMGSDTGGSVRLPASYTGVCGFKPSYGAVSRYGLTAFAPSFDVPGIMAHTPQDIAMVYQSLLKPDLRDQILKSLAFDWQQVAQSPQLKGLKIARFDTLLERADASVVKAYQEVCQLLSDAGAILKPVTLGLEEYLIKMYYIITCSEAATSLSRFDGARYGDAAKADSIESLTAQTRGQKMGHEVQRRILMGNYFLTAEHQEQWYKKALAMRAALVSKLTDLSVKDSCDVWLLPGFHEAALINTPDSDNYSSDSVAVLANLYGGPAVALPVSKGANQLPVSVQLMGTRSNDQQVLQVADFIYRQHNWKSMQY